MLQDIEIFVFQNLSAKQSRIQSVLPLPLEGKLLPLEEEEKLARGKAEEEEEEPTSSRGSPLFLSSLEERKRKSIPSLFIVQHKNFGTEMGLPAQKWEGRSNAKWRNSMKLTKFHENGKFS